MRTDQKPPTRFRRPWWSKGRWYWRPLPPWLPIPWNGVGGVGCGRIALVLFLCFLVFAFVACLPTLLR